MFSLLFHEGKFQYLFVQIKWLEQLFLSSGIIFFYSECILNIFHNVEFCYCWLIFHYKIKFFFLLVFVLRNTIINSQITGQNRLAKIFKFWSKITKTTNLKPFFLVTLLFIKAHFFKKSIIIPWSSYFDVVKSSKTTKKRNSIDKKSIAKRTIFEQF